METAKTRKQGSSVQGRHLHSLALRALFNTRQSVVARRLNVADSTILRRTEKYPEIMETLAASGIKDFVMKGEMKISQEQYRWLMQVAIRFAEYELERTCNEEGDEHQHRKSCP
ncbi:hypothetical protein [Pantoea agglomerans]|uniref:hypothetical protein n=1 Tax=Enterobacter agglomerans TaxID=549 RepID=UPI0015FBE0A0|nr:hypothetical protein [Pantoea agglomerans]MBA8870085.1 hypothetical protein [Pantoea agglomerans]MBA8874464.1 hypothetical protein [Pantoea agglomerans]